MLQPRSETYSNLLCTNILKYIIILNVLIQPFGLTQYVDSGFSVSPTPVLRLKDNEFTTVVLLKSKQSELNGRYFNLKPELGLLTSTARTFIQEGVTTEYATQVVGTTLKNGDLYAQFIKKSSRVLYDKNSITPSAVTSWVGEVQTRILPQSHNDLAYSNEPEWQNVEDRLLNDSVVYIVNTDQARERKLNSEQKIDEASYLGTQDLRSSSSYVTTSSAPLIIPVSVGDGKLNNNQIDKGRIVGARKVLQIADLPTYTVKNNFFPSGLENKTTQWVYSDAEQYNDVFDRVPKDFYTDASSGLQRNNSINVKQNSANRILATTTYYGFAEFTTSVGDSVIIFLPSTAQRHENFGHITSISGEATLDISSSSITVVSNAIKATPTSTNLLVETKYMQNNDIPFITNIETQIINTSESVASEESEESSTVALESSEAIDFLASRSNTETLSATQSFSLPSPEEISKIYAMLGKSETTSTSINSSKEPIEQSNGQSTETLGGATTIFFEDDIFGNFVEPTKIENNFVEPSNLETAISTTPKSVELNAIPVTTPTTDRPEENNFETTTEKPEETTTAESLNEEDTTTSNIISEVSEDTTTEKTAMLEKSTPNVIIKEVKRDDMDDSNCIYTSQVFLTQVPKSVTEAENTIPSFDIEEVTKHYCIQSSKTSFIDKTVLPPVTEQPLSSSAKNSNTESAVTTPKEELTAVITPKEELSEDIVQTTTVGSEVDYDDDDYENSKEEFLEEEIELIYKTLYTTYTYLTTFFNDDTTTVSSHTEIITKTITSTVNVVDEIKGTAVEGVKSTESQQSLKEQTLSTGTIENSRYHLIPSDFDTLTFTNDADSNDKNTAESTSSKALDENHTAKTYYTTYTYYTTIFADNESEIITRSEVFTNVLNIAPTKVANAKIELTTTVEMNDEQLLNTKEISESTTRIQSTQIVNSKIIEGDASVQLVMGVESSSSDGDIQLIDTQKNQDLNLFEDQISSESNTEEIIPSATLLLQTSFTTFTYYTTMYGTDGSNIISRLETVTNVVTETLQPTKTLNVQEGVLPVTYFTTFTYWTKLAKDGEITTLSREETISNVVLPTSTNVNQVFGTEANFVQQKLEPDHMTSNSAETVAVTTLSPILLSTDTIDSETLKPTTYYTTYTYYTTSYDLNETVTHSRLETVTNVETPVLTSTVINSNIPKETTSNQIESLEKITPTNSPSATIHLYDVKKIIDAEGISTLYFTTQILPTVNEFGIATEILSTTSSLYVDEDKKASVGTSSATPSLNEDGSTIRQYKTGLVRLIEGTRIGNLTTTLYQSKVIGTVIDNRYAQIIESTSSFIYENKTPYPFENVGTKTETTKVPERDDQEKTVTPDLGIIQSSITDQTDSLETKSVAAEQSDEITNKELQTANRVFSPVIRPFVSRNRPQFAPKKKILAPSSATIISRSDFIPTITATPALKTTGRFSTLRRTSNVAPSSTLGQSSRRFSRPSRLSSGSNNVLATQSLYSSSSLNSKNRFASSRISSVSKRLSTSLRPTSTGYGASNRFRFKPSTITPQLNSNEAVSTPDPIASDDDENVTLEADINQEETTTENSRRNQNPLLRFRRPLNRPSGFTPSTAQRASSSSSAVSPKRNPLTSRIKTTTTTTTTTTTSRPRQRSFARPPISLTQNRPRTSNNLFPPRTLFQLQKPSNSTNVKSESNKNNQNDSENDSEYDDDEEDGEFDSEEEGSRTKRSTKNPFEVRPKITKFRTKRNVEDTFQSRDNFRSRFRRPKILKTREEDQSPEEITESMTDVTKPLGRSRISSRFGSRNLSSNQKTSPVTTTTTPNNHRAVRPTRPTSSRTQFTLREKDTTPSSLRGQTRPTSNNLRKPTSNLRRTSPANSSFNRRFSTTNSHETSTRNYRGRNSNLGNTARSRTSTSRSRSRNDFNPENFIPDNGGTITVTHYLPSEVTIPVVNGKITEYKNVITAKSSTEVLGPQQYTSFIGKNGHSTLALAREYSTINYAGATEVTQFIIHESDTTSVIFTPTTIRGRKTSFAHVIPSTVYSIESITSTYNPQISANAPLANILLSQLLLGQIGLPSNPLLGAFGGIAQSSVDGQQGPVPTQATPMTEYRTHSSTYVTTLYEGMSTVLPVTFQGKKILTTIYETSAQTITATEFITDTIVTTPSQIAPQQPPQINSLLLQQLLLQQQLQQQQPEQTRLPFAEQMSVEIPTSDDIEEFGSVNLQGTNNNINLDDNSLHEESNQNQKSTKKKSKKSGKSHRRNKQQQQNLDDAINHDKPETSVITLYVSGRRPGEFSTVLSTVTVDNDATVHKRHAQNTGTYDNPNNFYNTDKEDAVFDENIIPTTANTQDEILLQLISPSANTIINNDVDRNAQNDQTESLESIVGDINMWHQKNTGSISSNVPKTTQAQNQQSRTFLV